MKIINEKTLERRGLGLEGCVPVRVLARLLGIVVVVSLHGRSSCALGCSRCSRLAWSRGRVWARGLR